MHPDNVFYGHRQVLAEWMGVSPDLPLRAHLQHGWAWRTPVLDARREVRGVPFLAWSGVHAGEMRRQGIPATPVGAPMLYLTTLKRQTIEASLPLRGSVIVYPVHSSDRQADPGSPKSQIGPLVDRYDPERVTICLYWVDFRHPQLRRVYEEVGFRVISHGKRDDPTFLWRQLDELLRHETVASNLVSTALLYGGAVRRRIEIIGAPTSVWGDEVSAARRQVQVDRWPKLFSDGFSPAEAMEAASAELGAAHLRASDELREITGVGRCRSLDQLKFTAAWQARRALAVADFRLRADKARARISLRGTLSER